MKTFVLILTLAGSLTANALNLPVTENVLERFNTTFPQATNVKWSAGEKTYHASFMLNQTLCKVEYNDAGGLVSQLRYYGENGLAPLLLAKLREQYRQPIFGITEFFNGQHVVYDIILEDSRRWTHVYMDAVGSINRVKWFRKAATR